MSAQSTFFGVVVPAEYSFRTLLKDTLLITRAVILPTADPDAHARLILEIGKEVAPICELNARDVTSAPLNVQLFPGTDVGFTVRGNADVHVTGYYEPAVDDSDVFIAPIPIKLPVNP